MPKVALYTAIYGGYDELTIPMRQTQPMDFYLFTEHAVTVYDLAPTDTLEPKVVTTYPAYNPNMPTVAAVNRHRMTAVQLRCRPDQITLLKDYDIVIYMDGNLFLPSASFLSDYFVAQMAKNPAVDMVISQHEARNCIYAEVALCKQIGKYNNTDFDRMVPFYWQAGIKPSSGLYWNGLVAYNMQHDLRRFFELYSRELFAYAKNPELPYFPQGQVSLPYCLRETGVHLLAGPPLYGGLVRFKRHLV